MLSKKIHFLKYCRYYFDVIKFLLKRNALRQRDEGNTNKRLITFRKYATDENRKAFLSKLDIHGQRIGELLMDKIEKIMYNNILPYKDIFNFEEKKEQEAFAKFCIKNKDEIPFNIKEVGSYLNYFYIENLDDEFKDLKGKDIIDCGGYNGDSSLAMVKYLKDIGNVYCIEPERENFKNIEKKIVTQNTQNIIPINLGLGDRTFEAVITEGGAGSNLSTDERTKGTKIHIDTIDNIVDNYKINPGLIKRDIEGFEYSSIVGAKETIMKYKPVLLISIYHTGKDRFEMLPLIDSRNLDYKFTIRRWNCFHPFADTLLVCY